MKEYASLAIKNLNRRKLRSGLTLLGIIIAIATIFVLISVSLGLEEAIEEQFRLLGADKFFIQPRGQAAGPGSGGAVELTIEDINTIEKVAGVKEVSYAAIGNAKIEYRDQIRYNIVVGIPLDRSDLFVETGAYEAEEGSFLRERDNGKVMVGSQYKHNNVFSQPITAQDKIFINDVRFEVKAVLEPIGNPADDRNIFLPLEDFRKLFNNTGDRVDQIIVQVGEGEDVNEVAERVRRRLLNSRDLREEERDFSIFTPEEILESFNTILNILTGFLTGVAAISLLVGAIGVANTMYTSVLERTKEIGVMKAVGAKNSDILSIFLIESGLLGLVGGIVGVLFGIFVGFIIEYIALNQLGTTLLRVSTPLYLILGCLVFAFLVGAISGVWPAWNASKVNPVKALRYE